MFCEFKQFRGIFFGVTVILSSLEVWEYWFVTGSVYQCECSNVLRPEDILKGIRVCSFKSLWVLSTFCHANSRHCKTQLQWGLKFEFVVWVLFESVWNLMVKT